MEKKRVTQKDFDQIKANVKEKALSSGFIISEEEFGAVMGFQIIDGEDAYSFILPGFNNTFFIIDK